MHTNQEQVRPESPDAAPFCSPSGSEEKKRQQQLIELRKHEHGGFENQPHYSTHVTHSRNHHNERRKESEQQQLGRKYNYEYCTNNVIVL